MTHTLPIPNLEFRALHQALERSLRDRNMTWEKFEVGAQLARLEVSAQLEGFLDVFLKNHPGLRDGLARFEATRAWVSRLVLALLLAWHEEDDLEPRASWEARPFSVQESAKVASSVLSSRALDFGWGSNLNLALMRVRSCVVWARYLG